MMNDIVNRIYDAKGLPRPAVPDFQRNQNQSAVGGSDVKNPYRLAIEVKRQEQLSINTWWKQLEAAATRDNEWPILIFKQNRKAWRVIMLGQLALPLRAPMLARCEVDIDTFKQWAHHYLADTIEKNLGITPPTPALHSQAPMLQGNAKWRGNAQ